jgi:hypothetical protein
MSLQRRDFLKLVGVSLAAPSALLKAKPIEFPVATAGWGEVKGFFIAGEEIKVGELVFVGKNGKAYQYEQPTRHIVYVPNESIRRP